MRLAGKDLFKGESIPFWLKTASASQFPIPTEEISIGRLGQTLNGPPAQGGRPSRRIQERGERAKRNGFKHSLYFSLLLTKPRPDVSVLT